MNNPLVSVVIPVYNVERYLNRCVESVVNQTYKHLEIILVDDGSPDNCPNMCDEWAKKDSRIKVIHKQNQGAGFARNTGIDIATGKFICFFDSDDYIDDSTIAKCVESATKNNADVVMFGHNDAYPNGAVKSHKVISNKYVFSGAEIVNEVLPSLYTYDFGLGISLCMKMFDLDLINRNGLRLKSEQEVASEDAFFILELFPKSSTVTIIPECLYYYYKNGNSFSRTYRENMIETNNMFIIKSLSVAESLKLPQSVKSHLKVRYHYYVLAAMKLLLLSNYCKKDKKQIIKAMFSNKVLHSTLDFETLKLEGKMLRLFFIFIKLKWYVLSLLMLKIKISRQDTR